MSSLPTHHRRRSALVTATAAATAALTLSPGVAHARLDNPDDPGQRIGMVTKDQMLYLNDGLTQESYDIFTDVSKAYLLGDRQALITTDKRLFARDGYTSWRPLGVNVKEAYLEGNRIGFLQNSGAFYVLDGVNGRITLMRKGVSRGLLEGNRIGIQVGSWFSTRESKTAAWRLQTKRAKDVYLEGKRIAYRSSTGWLYAKDSATGSFRTVSGAVKKAVFSGNRIGAIIGTTAYTKDTLGSRWVKHIGSVKEMYLTANRIGILQTNNVLYARDGAKGKLVKQAGAVSQAAFRGSRIAVVVGGTVYAKDGLNRPWAQALGTVTSITLN